MLKLKRAFARLKISWFASPRKQKRAIKKAIILNKKNGKRYRVFFVAGRYRVWQRNDIRHLRNEGVFRPELKPGSDFDKIAIFDTLKNNPYVRFCR